MKSELDRLMQEAGLDALLIVGPAGHNPNMTYFTGPVHVTSGYLLKPRGEEPVLFHRRMERDEAARSGLQTRLLADFRPEPDPQRDPIQTELLLLERLLAEYGTSGRVSLYGKSEIGESYAVFHSLQHSSSELELMGEPARSSVLARARATKNPEEVDAIRRMGEITLAVVGNVADFLCSHTAKDGVLVNSQGELLMVGGVKQRINLWLAMRGAENLEGSIFSIGRDAGVPHSTGRDDQPVSLGETIIFDIFPSRAGGGYFYDFTRTWCLGHASEQAEALHGDVLQVYETVAAELRSGGSCREYQVRTCELFEAGGHPTVLNTPATTDGYVHGLGHGLGLAIHEAPGFSHLESNQDRLEPGTVFTFEPGLYYPEQGMGVRLEDTLYVRPDGEIEPLAEYPKELVLKVPGT